MTNDELDTLIINTVNANSSGIGLKEISEKVYRSFSTVRYRVFTLAAAGELRVESTRHKFIVYPASKAGD